MDYKFLGGDLPLVNFRSAGWVRYVKRTKDGPLPQNRLQIYGREIAPGKFPVGRLG